MYNINIYTHINIYIYIKNRFMWIWQAFCGGYSFLSFHPHLVLRGAHHYSPHFTDEEAEVFKCSLFSEVPLNRWRTWDSNSQSFFSLVLSVGVVSYFPFQVSFFSPNFYMNFYCFFLPIQLRCIHYRNFRTHKEKNYWANAHNVRLCAF